MFTRKSMALLAIHTLTSLLASAECDKRVKFVTEKVYQVQGDSTDEKDCR
jgi:hypothetical protein